MLRLQRHVLQVLHQCNTCASRQKSYVRHFHTFPAVHKAADVLEESFVNAEIRIPARGPLWRTERAEPREAVIVRAMMGL